MLFLKEELSSSVANLVESVSDGKNTYLSGIFMQGDVKNRNGRNYPMNEIAKAVAAFNKSIKEGNYILGELNHPPELSIDLKNVSHMITEIWIDGNSAVGKAKILNTPMGNIVQGLLDGGVRLGVSSRGTGNVNNEGIVSDFSCTCVDIVATPSAPDAYPNMIREQLENTPKIMSLAEAVCVDPKAQKYFQKELQVFIAKLMRVK